jgi:hypothetical protein
MPHTPAKNPRQSLHKRTHSLVSALLSAAEAAHHMHGHFLSGTDTEALGHMTALISQLDTAMKDRREITRLIKNAALEKPTP